MIDEEMNSGASSSGCEADSRNKQHTNQCMTKDSSRRRRRDQHVEHTDDQAENEKIQPKI